VEMLCACFEKTCEAQQLDPVKELASFLCGAEGESFWQKAKTNLQAGRVRLVFVADEIPLELRRVIEFLNGQMDPAEVLAVEVKQYIGEGKMKTLVPRLIGQTVKGGNARTPSIGRDKGRSKIMGYAITPLIRWMGADSWTADQARKVIDHFDASDYTSGSLKATIKEGATGNTKWGTPAEVTQAQAEELRRIRDKA
jgi:hypothetical protein